jgi:hypothetical protein
MQAFWISNWRTTYSLNFSARVSFQFELLAILMVPNTHRRQGGECEISRFRLNFLHVIASSRSKELIQVTTTCHLSQWFAFLATYWFQ